MVEQWKKIEGYEDYLVSNLGKIYSTISNKTLSSWELNDMGYRVVALRRKKFLVHRLVAEAYIDNPDNLPQVHHIDNDRSNNRVDNLAWVTAEENLSEMRSRNGDTSGTARKALLKVSSKPVYKVSLDGVILAEYPSVTKAAEDIKGIAGKIGQVANGRRNSHKGFIWKWVNPQEANRSLSKKK